jgi:hypothetical protein
VSARAHDVLASLDHHDDRLVAFAGELVTTGSEAERDARCVRTPARLVGF